MMKNISMYLFTDIWRRYRYTDIYACPYVIYKIYENIHTTEYYPFVTKKKILPWATAWMAPESRPCVKWDISNTHTAW